jgi:flavin reductase (DIM6/NTAB) family NADH-FMN oxidoreductase RutF
MFRLANPQDGRSTSSTCERVVAIPADAWPPMSTERTKGRGYERAFLASGNMNGISSELVDSRHLRRSVGQFVTGVTVVTYDLDGSPRGVTVNSFTSVSVDPPLILVSIARNARAASGLSGSPLVVNVLAADQLELARHFAGQCQERLKIPWSRHHNPPRLRGAVAWIECRPYAEVEAGDHILFVARVMSHRTLSKEPLLFHTGRFRLIGEDLGSKPAAEDNVLAWQLISQAQTLAEDGVPAPDPTT